MLKSVYQARIFTMTVQQVCCGLDSDGCSVTVTQVIRLTALSVAMRLFTHGTRKVLDAEDVLSCAACL